MTRYFCMDIITMSEAYEQFFVQTKLCSDLEVYEQLLPLLLTLTYLKEGN